MTEELDGLEPSVMRLEGQKTSQRDNPHATAKVDPIAIAHFSGILASVLPSSSTSMRMVRSHHRPHHANLRHHQRRRHRLDL